MYKVESRIDFINAPHLESVVKLKHFRNKWLAWLYYIIPEPKMCDYCKTSKRLL